MLPASLTPRAREPEAIGGAVTQSEPLGPILLRAQGLKKRFGGQIVLDGVDLELRQGEVVLLRGENGSGKTTLLNMFTGNLEPDFGTIHYLADNTPRSYTFPRRWWQELNPFDHFTPEFVAREGVCRTWQDVRLFKTQTLSDNLAVAEPGHPGENPLIALLSPRRASRREEVINRDAHALLARLGLDGREESSADKISLGQTKRVAIARALAAGARILFLDEPLAGLDGQGISDVLDLLKELVREHRVTLVIVEHVFNQSHLRDLVTTNWLLKDGAIQRTDGNGEHQDVRCFHSAVSTETLVKRPSWFALLSGRDAEILDEPLPRGALFTRIRRPEHFRGTSTPILEIRNLIVRRGSRAVIGMDDTGSLSGFDLTLFQGEVAILFAPNGWGKSTLLASISGLIPSDSGSIVFDGKLLDGLSVSERFHLGLRALPSNHQLFPSLLVKDVMRLVGCNHTVHDLGGLSNRNCSSLSGGERKRIALAAMTGGTVGLYDEPFSALDELSATEFPTLGLAGAPSAQFILAPGQY